jgi:hypothetical protein
VLISAVLITPDFQSREEKRLQGHKQPVLKNPLRGER